MVKIQDFKFFIKLFFKFLSSILGGENKSQPKSLKLHTKYLDYISFSFFLQKQFIIRTFFFISENLNMKKLKKLSKFENFWKKI